MENKIENKGGEQTIQSAIEIIEEVGIEKVEKSNAFEDYYIITLKDGDSYEAGSNPSNTSYQGYSVQRDKGGGMFPLGPDEARSVYRKAKEYLGEKEK
jgi:hypothetical protein